MAALSSNEDYLSKLTSAEEAVALVDRGKRVFVGSVAGEPRELLRALAGLGPRPGLTLAHRVRRPRWR